MADTQPLTPSTPATLPSGGGLDIHAMLQRIEGLLSWTKDHLIQSHQPGGDVTDPENLAAEREQVVRDYAKRGAAPNQAPASEGGMSADVLARAASRTPTQYQTGNPGGAEAAPAGLLTPEAFAQVIKAKHPELATVPDRDLAAQWLEKYPVYRDRVATDANPPVVGNDRTRQDTTMIGIDHQALAHKIANWASTLPPTWQKPAAMLATFPADVLASLVEMVSSPEGVATGASTPRGAAVLDAAQTGTGRALASTGRLVETISSKLEKPARYLGAWELLRDPVKGTVTIVAPTVTKAVGQGLQRAGTALAGEAASSARGLSLAEEAALYKQGYSPKIVDQIRQQLKTGSAVPAGTAAAPAAPASGSPAPSAPAPPVTQATKVKLSAEEFDAAQRLVRDGHDPQQVLRAILTQRAEAPAAELARRLGTPTEAEMRAQIEHRNETGRWPGEQP